MTWLPVSDDGRPERDVILSLAPEAWQRFREMLDLTWGATNPELIELCRIRLAQMIDCKHELAGISPARLAEIADWQDGPFTELEHAALDYAEQFHVDQNQLSDQQKDTVAELLQPHIMVDFVIALYANDLYQRMLTLLDIEPDARAAISAAGASGFATQVRSRMAGRPAEHQSSHAVIRGSGSDAALQEARVAFHAAATRHRRWVDAQTSELVRLRNANYQQCTYCASARRPVDHPEGVDDLMALALEFESSELVSDAQKAALRMTDAFITYPAGMSVELRDELLMYFSPEAIVELLFELAAWMMSKIWTALGSIPQYGSIVGEVVT